MWRGVTYDASIRRDGAIAVMAPPNSSLVAEAVMFMAVLTVEN
jgi:hypothetical protein